MERFAINIFAFILILLSIPIVILCWLLNRLNDFVMWITKNDESNPDDWIV